MLTLDRKRGHSIAARSECRRGPLATGVRSIRIAGRIQSRTRTVTSLTLRAQPTDATGAVRTQTISVYCVDDIAQAWFDVCDHTAWLRGLDDVPADWLALEPTREQFLQAIKHYRDAGKTLSPQLYIDWEIDPDSFATGRIGLGTEPLYNPRRVPKTRTRSVVYKPLVKDTAPTVEAPSPPKRPTSTKRKPRKTAYDVLMGLGAAHPDRVVILDSAARSADSASRFHRVPELRQLLRKLIGPYLDAKQRGEDDQSAVRRIFGHINVAFSESRTITKAGRRRRTFVYRDKQIYMPAHLKLGISRAATNTIRVHFRYVNNVIVIGYCGKHLNH